MRAVAAPALDSKVLSPDCVIAGDEVVFAYQSNNAAIRRPAVVFVHGVGVSSESVLPTARLLAASHHVIVPDLPGFGRSSCGERYLDTAELADAVALFLRIVDVQSAVLVGSSYGCQVAVEVAIRHPVLVKGLALASLTVDPAARGMVRQLWRWARNLIRERDIQQDSTSAGWRRAGISRVAATGRECVRHPMNHRLPLVRVPTVLVRGDHDVIVPQRWLEEAERLTPDASTAVVAGAAHSVAFTHPAELAALIEAVVAKVEL